MVSTADAKAQLRVDDSDEDSLIDALVKAATEKLEEHCRQAFIEQTWQVTLEEFPAAGIQLPRAPLVGVEKVSYWPDLASSVARGRGAKLVVGASSSTLSRALTGATTGIFTDSKRAFEDVDFYPIDSVGANSTNFGSTGGVSAGTYFVDYRADGSTVWSEFFGWDVDPGNFVSTLIPRADDLPETSSEGGAPWAIKYKAGYGSSPSDVPEAIIAAVKGLMTHLFEHRGEDPRQVPIPDFISYIVSHLVVPHKL